MPKSSICDGLYDCIDQTDESNCLQPNFKEYQDVFENCIVNEKTITKIMPFKMIMALNVEGITA